MKPHLADLVDVILRRLEEHPDVSPSENGMRSWLAGQGYKKSDIDAAIKLVRPKFTALLRGQKRQPRTLRHLSNYETFKLSPEARSAIARLELYDLIEPYEREMILDRLGQFEGEVGLEDLDYLLSWVMSATRDIESQQTIFEVFEGRDYTMH